MLREFKFLRRNSGKNEEIENVPVNPRDSLLSEASTVSSSYRAPLNAIQDPVTNPQQETESQSKIQRTPTKPRAKNPDPTLPLRTPDSYRAAIFSKNRFGWAEKNDNGSNPNVGGNGILESITPRANRAISRGNSGFSESNSTQTTPMKSVSKPPASSCRSKFDGNGGTRGGSFASLYKRMSSSSGQAATVVNTIEVPHFDLKEDPSFWMDHNVQVLMRIRPLNSMEKSTNGYNRCLKQESSKSITWIGQPETRFTFDHVACETIDQETLFKMAGLQMVENCLSGYNSCIFAYGQTGSGKTYTMLGEIDDLEVKPSPNRGMMPRIFEFLFARIRAEEESRRDEKLKYNCKCSFVEIYNEQITDLLDPCSTNLLLREDVKKGVYVENLTEYAVQSVRDILRLITQGSLNRKVAVTNMNRESSRSHSVFTCVIESRWEKDSTTNLRFARLNLVDLAGSERQKTSGAEGERLKEAANINKSLSTLGHVIMILLDVVNGKLRHVPYRDSKLTFLLQDSLGGNSKTMIIANVSPSIFCAAETLNTLKFAQRAKLIQNNAVVNEDSTGDVMALQHQIQLLKEELSIIKRQNVSRSLSFGSGTTNVVEVQTDAHADGIDGMEKQLGDGVLVYETGSSVKMSSKQLKSLETTLTGALRREQMAETSIKKLEAEIEHLNRLVRQREEDTRSTKMMLRFREDKIQRLESLLDSHISADSFLQEENGALSEENQLLQAKLDKNPELTRFALENIRLLDQLRRFQEFYKEGEREIVLAEVSNLRDQLLQFLDGMSDWHKHADFNVQSQDALHVSKENNSLQKELKNTLAELEECRCNLDSCLEENGKLSREIQDLQALISNSKAASPDGDGNVKIVKVSLGTRNDKLDKALASESVDHAESIIKLQLDLDILKIILEEERSSHAKTEEQTLCINRELEESREQLLVISKQRDDANSELKESKSKIEALESQHILSIYEVEDERKRNYQYLEILRIQELEIAAMKDKLCSKELKGNPSEGDSTIGSKFKRMQDSLEKAKRLNILYKSDTAFKTSRDEEMDEVRGQAEAATAEVIVCMQNELEVLQKEVQDFQSKETESKKQVMLLETELKELRDKLYYMTENNQQLLGKLGEKDEELKVLSDEMEFLTCEVEEILINGHEALADARDQVDLISSSFPQKRIWISEQVGGLIRMISQKELLIKELGRCLEDANNKKYDVECMLKSLGGAALVINETHQQECNEKEKEILHLKSELGRKTETISGLEEKLRMAESRINKVSSCATAAFLIVSRLSQVNDDHTFDLRQKDIQLRESDEVIQFLKKEVAELEKTCDDLRMRLSEAEHRASGMEQKLEYLKENEILRTRQKLSELKIGVSELRFCMNMRAEPEKSPGKDNSPLSPDRDGSCEERELRYDAFGKENTSHDDSKGHTHTKLMKASKLACGRDMTIILLKNEIESALESLKEVQLEMVKIRDEKEELEISEEQTKTSFTCLTSQLRNLETAMNNFEQQSKHKIDAANHTIASLEFEFADVKIVAAQEGVENSYILAKFEEAQDIIKEADITINEQLIANEKMKLGLERQKQMETTLVNEKDVLSNKIRELEYVNDLKELKLENLEKQFELNLMETRDLVNELESIIRRLAEDSSKAFMRITHDFSDMKSVILETRSARSSLEDIWSEIIMKDCALSVLHLCHTGILLETITGMNTENGLLQHGLCESNSIIADMREHNFKLRRELEMCRKLKGKLLADIKNSFDRISREEEETNKFGHKLKTFEQKISGLQHQEELMLERSNSTGFQLAILIKELNSSNGSLMTTLLDQEKLLKDKDELLNSQEEHFMLNFRSKEIELLILAHKLQDISSSLEVAERGLFNHHTIFEKLKEELFVSMVDKELGELCLVGREIEAVLVEENLKKMLSDMQVLLSNLEHELGEVTKTKMELLKQVQELKAENEKLLVKLRTKERGLELSTIQLSFMNQENKKLQEEFFSLETSSRKLQNEIEELKMENNICILDLEDRTSMIESSVSHINSLKMENHTLQEKVCSLESCIANLQKDMEMKVSEINSLQHSQSATMEELGFKIKDLQIYVDKISALKEENNFLKNKLNSCEVDKYEALNISRLSIAKCVDLTEFLHMKGSTMFDKLCRDGLLIFDKISKFTDEVELLQLNVHELLSENLNLHDELLRKDEILKGLSFDLILLQESDTNSRDQKDEIEEMMIDLEALEEKLASKTCELDKAVAHSQMLEVQMQEKINRISTLESEISKERESQKLLSNENMELKAHVEDTLATKSSLEKELTETKKETENMEIELTDLSSALRQLNDTIKSLRSTLNEITNERDNLQEEILYLKEKLEKAEAEAKEIEAKCLEAQEIAESRRIYAEERKEEVKLLETSVEELECTVNVLENKVSIVKGEAERQRLPREELELELHAINQQMQKARNADDGMKRLFDGKQKDLEEALKHIEVLERDMANKNTEIVQCRAHISELTLHAEAQASEYKQKFKELEAMAEQVKPESHVSHALNSSSNKNLVKPRGSSSPFKCIGLGLAQQMKSEKDEELSAARLRIEELESLVASRQKEIFALNARLATVESMTHDVIRDLIGVKLNVTNYTSLLETQQVQKMAEKVQLDGSGSQLTESDVIKLKQQLNEFIEERQGWIEEIERKQAELIAAQIALEKHRQHEQLLKSENEMLKTENVSHKRKVLELEGEVKKLSGQQNLQQRIHHHAKVKEENNMLKIQNEELSVKLRRTEGILSRVKEELACYRASCGKNPCINFEEERRLSNKLKETEEDRVELAHKLLGLCTSVLKAAGLTKHVSDINPAVAEEALEQLKTKVASLERELQHLKLKNKITSERNRLSELMPQSSSPRSSWTEENCQSPRRVSQTPFLSALDR